MGAEPNRLQHPLKGVRNTDLYPEPLRRIAVPEKVLEHNEELLFFGRDCQLSNHLILINKWYVSNSQNLFYLCNFQPRGLKMDIETDEKELIEELIRGELRERESGIDQVKGVIRNEIAKRRSVSQQLNDETGKKQHVNVSLGPIDEAFINKKYIEYCFDLWVQEVGNFLTNYYRRENDCATENLNYDILEDLLNSFDTIQNLGQIPVPLNQLQYYARLTENRRLMSQNNEETFIRKFKSICSEQIVNCVEFVQTELDFLKAFVDFLLASRSMQEIVRKLQLQSFCSGDLPFDKLTEGIMNLQVNASETELLVLRGAVHRLKEEKALFLTKTFRRVIKDYIEPVKIEEKTLDGRSVIETTGKSIVLTDILHKLETLLSSNSDIAELRVVGADILHIDANLENLLWHGKNVVILAKIIKIHDKVTWDVSGKDNDHTYSDNAGTEADGRGKQGADGYAGESGGNVSIIADEIKNPENFTIISHGGNGSKGQDGGNGIDGKDGEGITVGQFKKSFPSVVSFLPTRLERGRLFDITVKNIRRPGASVKTHWSVDGNEFIEAKTIHGTEITFSHNRAAPLRCLQALLLCKGSSGQPGACGGECGLGGEGGYGGQITTNNPKIVEHADKGKPGGNGQGGLHGDPGRNGWDVGYTDYQHWLSAKIYGTDERSKLQLKYHDTTWGKAPSDSIWCPYHAKYAQITASQVDHVKIKKYQERMDTGQNRVLQHQARAKRMKSISVGKIVADYSYCYSSIGRDDNTQSTFDEIMNRALQALVDNAEQQEKVTTELKVKHIKSVHPAGSNHRYKTAARTSDYDSRNLTNNNTLDIESLIMLLNNDSGVGNEYSALENAELSRSDLDRLISHFERMSVKSPENAKIRNMKQLLREKYRFAVLREVANRLPDYDNNSNNPVMNLESARYLIVAKENDNQISHNILGTLSQYLFVDGTEQREKIYRFFHEELRNSRDNKPLQRSVGTFVLKEIRSEQVNSSIGRHKVEYEKFLEKKFQSLKTFWEPFRRVLVQDKYRDIFALWIKRDDCESSRCHLNREIQKDEFLNALYILFNRQLTESFDWNKCCTDKNFLQEYIDAIRERGPFSESYRELLAYVFNVNIKFYEGRGNQFHMTYNHNPSSEKTVHVLSRENELKQLNIDKAYLRLEEQHTKMGKIYAEVLAETEKFNKKQELDDYLERKTFSTDDTWEICLSENNGERQENPCKFCTEELESTDNQHLKRSIRTFVLEVGESQKIHPHVKKHYQKFKKFSKEQERSLITFFEPFYRELKRHKHVYALWAANHENKCSTSELEKEIKQYDLLNALHQRFQHQFKQEYDWNECCENKHVLREFYRHVDQKGQPPGRCSDLRHQFIDEYTRKEEERTLRDDPCTQIFPTNNMFKLEEESDYFLERQIFHLDINLSDREYRDCEEQDIGNIIKHFSRPEERLQIKERLEKISFQYIGHRGILNNISRRFSNDGRHVSFQELCCLVNSILTSVIQGRKQQNVFCWIVAAYPQNCWIDEVVLLQLENYFRKQLPAKSNWRAYLSGITDKAILLSLTLKLNQHKSNSDIAPQCIEDALKLLSYMPNEAVSLERLDLREWPNALKEKYWVCKLSQLANWPDSESLSEASYYLSSMENTFGTPLVEKLMEILEGKEDVVPEALTTILSNFYNERCNLDTQELESLSSCGIKEWVRKTGVIADQSERDVTLLVELIKGNANTSKNILDKLPEIESSILSISTKDPVVEPPAGRVERTYEWVKSIPNVLQGTLIVSKLPAVETAATNGLDKNTRVTDVERVEDDAATSRETLDKSPAIETPTDSFRKLVSAFIEKPVEKCTKTVFTGYSWTCREFFDSCKDSTEKKKFIEDTRIITLAMVDKAIELTRGFKLRDTQKLAILTLLTNENDTLAQISTGEGKSLIVVAAAIMKVISREKVDIITSSSVLAKRDAEANRDIYRLFGIGVSHNCIEDIEKRRQAYSRSEVVYGDLSSFQRDYLLDQFYEKNILGDRDFENIFVDEVDSMLLDKGNNMLYLSHDLPGLDKLESLFVYIWQLVNRPAKNQSDLSSNFDIGAIKKAVLKELYGLITKEDIKKLDSELDDQQATIILNRLIAAEILDDQGKMLRGNIDDSELEIILAPQFNNYKNRLCYLLDECIQRTKSIHVPNCFTAFIQQHLEVWIDSAVKAAVMQEGHHYVVDVDRTGTSQDINPRITIIDKDTGTDQANSQWDEALHQFLQLKHGCELSLQSLKAVFISNVSYLKRYKNLYGVTGTLGSQIERKFLTEIHKIDFISIPTAKPKQFQEERPILCNGKAEWLEEIYTEARRITKRKKRSILIICETIDDVETLNGYFLGKRTKNVHTYTRDYEEFDITQGTRKLGRGQIIIATNLSGRGTDIRITEELRIAGGLHICMTYLPPNGRIEQQAFGRAARSGDKGSGRLIIRSLDGQEYSKGKILDLKKQRDVEELHRVSDLKAYYETQIITEETFFKEFTTQYRALRENLTSQGVSVEVKQILMHSCLDKWAFWLDRNSKYMENVTHEHDRNNSKDLLNDFILELKNLMNKDHKTWVEEQPVQMIKLGKCFCQTRKYDDAIELFDKVIELEPRFSEAAHYYKAFAVLKKIDWSKKALREQNLQQFKAELREAARLFEEHNKFSMYAAGIIDAIKQHSDKSVIQVNSYREQQKNLSNLYSMFSRSIDDILGKSLTPTSFIGGSITEALSELIYEDLLSNGILKKPQIESSISEVVLNKISFDFGITKGELKTCLSAFEGNEIDEKEFEKSFKERIKLPSREDFWKMLVQENILNQEVRYIIVDVEKLEKLDPSLSCSLRSQIDNNKLAQKILNYRGSNEIVLSPEQAGPQQGPNMPQEDRLVLEKADLLKVLADDEKYEFLKKKGVFTYNRKACINLTNSASANLPRYDSITLDDFENANIARTDAEVILAGLVEQRVLQVVNSEDEIYRLVIPFNQIKKIQFPSYPVYRTAVIGLLSLCFVYRMALERIGKELKEKKNLIYPRLPEKPHHDLIYALMEDNVIGSVKFNTEMQDLQNQLTNLYSKAMTNNELELMLAQSKLLPKGIVPDELLQHLVEKGWLYVYETRPDVSETDPLYPFYMEMQSALDIQYSINSIEYRQRLSLYGDIEETIANIFNDRLELAKEETIEQIRRVLKQSRSPLITLEVPDGVLKPVAEHKRMDGTQYTVEINTFTLSGLDQLLQIEENKWTSKMIFNTITVILIGAIQIFAGFWLKAITKSLKASRLFVSEGIHDIMYAINLLRSGQFSWRNYFQQKCRRLMCLTVEAFKRVWSSIKSLFGARVGGFEVDHGEEAEETIELIESNETNTRTETSNHIILRNINAAVFRLADGGVDVIVRNYLERLCDDIGSAVLSGIIGKIEEKFSISLERTYQVLGEKEAMNLVNDLAEDFLNERNLTDKYLPIAMRIARSVTQSIENAVKKENQYGRGRRTPLAEIIKSVLALVPKVDDLDQVDSVRNITDSLLNSLQNKLDETLGENAIDYTREQVQGCESFKRKSIHKFKSSVNERVGRIMDRHIVRRILNDSGGCLMGYCERIIKMQIPLYNDGGNNERMEEFRWQYQNSQRSTYLSVPDNLTEIQTHAVNEYHHNLNELITKTHNYKLLASLVRENIPVDVSCLWACIPVLRRVSDTTDLTIIAKERGRKERRFSSFSVEEVMEKFIIHLELVKNRFRLHGAGTPQNNGDGDMKINCLYETVSDYMNLNMTPESFRAKVANCIERDPDVQYQIKQEWSSSSTLPSVLLVSHDTQALLRRRQPASKRSRSVERLTITYRQPVERRSAEI